ncbi:MAG: BON domain-containing protein, partial [Pseudomonadota bacterium]|nr:BON domain-containing protein [Pseudomonadota bacterium]
GYTRSDERIREDVCERLTQDPHVDASDIEISVSSREVTLSGFVDSREAKRRAEDIADHVSGVTHVQNNLRVRQPGMGSATAMGGNAGTTSGGGLSSNTVSDIMGAPSGLGSTGVEASRTEGGTSRRKSGGV